MNEKCKCKLCNRKGIYNFNNGFTKAQEFKVYWKKDKPWFLCRNCIRDIISDLAFEQFIILQKLHEEKRK